MSEITELRTPDGRIFREVSDIERKLLEAVGRQSDPALLERIDQRTGMLVERLVDVTRRLEQLQLRLNTLPMGLQQTAHDTKAQAERVQQATGSLGDRVAKLEDRTERSFDMVLKLLEQQGETLREQQELMARFAKDLGVSEAHQPPPERPDEEPAEAPATDWVTVLTQDGEEAPTPARKIREGSCKLSQHDRHRALEQFLGDREITIVDLASQYGMSPWGLRLAIEKQAESEKRFGPFKDRVALARRNGWNRAAEARARARQTAVAQ